MQLDLIPIDSVHGLAGLFRARVDRSPDATAYRYFDDQYRSWCDSTWQQMAAEIGRWQQALRDAGLRAGDHVAVMARNCRQWVMFDQAALGLGLVVVPLYLNDRGDNLAYILADAQVKLLLLDGAAQWNELRTAEAQLDPQLMLWSIGRVDHPRVVEVEGLLPAGEFAFEDHVTDVHALATIVYTSGTTGKPKGVMLSHHNILFNAAAVLQTVKVYRDDLFLSFLPLSHTLERTVGYYLPVMAGATVAYARSIPQLGEDMLKVQPTILISVPRIYERIYGVLQDKLGSGGLGRSLFDLTVKVGWRRFQIQQGRAAWTPNQLLWPLLSRIVASKLVARFGGRLRLAISGGAPMPQDAAQVFVGLGLNILQGYGMTETSPVIAGNRLEANLPSSVGQVLPGIEVRIGDNDELQTRSPSVMLGYWNLPEATAQIIDQDGWLHTGDKAKIEQGFVTITGRLKDIIVLANGEKLPPADMEMAICSDPLFEQAMIVGEGRPFLSALVVLDQAQLEKLGHTPSDKELLAHVDRALAAFPGYAKIRRLHALNEAWTVENGMLTPTLKVKRAVVAQRYQAQIDALYEGH